jgi:hypothetical protein
MRFLTSFREGPRQGLSRRQRTRPLARTPSHSTPTLLQVGSYLTSCGTTIRVLFSVLKGPASSQALKTMTVQRERLKGGKGLTPPIQCGLEDRSSVAGLSEGDNHRP